MASAAAAAERTLMTKTRVFALATLAPFAFASTAQAATIRYAHQDWHTFKSTGNLGQHWDPAMVSISNHVLTERIQGDVAGGIGSTRYKLRGRWVDRAQRAQLRGMVRSSAMSWFRED